MIDLVLDNIMSIASSANKRPLQLHLQQTKDPFMSVSEDLISPEAISEGDSICQDLPGRKGM